MVDLYTMSERAVQRGTTSGSGSSSSGTDTYANISHVNPAFATTFATYTSTGQVFYPGITPDGNRIYLGKMNQTQSARWQVIG